MGKEITGVTQYKDKAKESAHSRMIDETPVYLPLFTRQKIKMLINLLFFHKTIPCIPYSGNYIVII
jgi:hypothetical protein